MGSQLERKFFTKHIVRTVASVLAISILAAFVVVAIRNAMNQDAIIACEELGGIISERDYTCLLPDGHIVEPISWLAVHDG